MMHELPWITTIGSRVRRFASGFYEWQSHERKSLANRVIRDRTIVIHGIECIILFLMGSFMSWTHNSTKDIYWSLITPLSLRMVFSDLAFWRHHNWSVTSREPGVLTLWRHIRRLLLHAQMGPKEFYILVNNNREYRFLTARYSRLSV